MEGKDLRDKYPEGADPYASGEAANTRLAAAAMTSNLNARDQMFSCTIERA